MSAIPSLGIESKVGNSTTLDISGTYDPITFPNDRKWKNWMVQPELRHWFKVPFAGPFVGLNVIGGGFNIARLPFAQLKEKRAQGSFYGAGITVGYHKILTPHWGFEVNTSLDYLHMDYSRYRCGHCGYKEMTFSKNYITPTRFSFSIVYMIK